MGRAEISELAPDEAHIAAVVSISGRDGGIPLRFHQGKFYKESIQTRFDTGSSGLETALGYAICEHMISERASAASIGPFYQGGAWEQILWSMWGIERQSQRVRRCQQAVPENIWAATKSFDPNKQDGDMLSHWADIASNYVSSVLSIEGKLSMKQGRTYQTQ